MSRVEVLEWDSEFFGHRTARIADRALDRDALAGLLDELRDNGTRLVYWSVDAGDSASRLAAEQLGGFLADLKTTYRAEFASLGKECFAAREGIPRVEVISGTELTADLRRLAVQSGEYSRFAIDPCIPRERFESLYESWIEGCLEGRLADETFAIRDPDRIVAFLSASRCDNHGEMELVAVEPKAREHGLGKRLVCVTHSWFRRCGLRTAQVVTQRTNDPAGRLYEGCGYRICSVEAFFHFWL